MEFTSLGIHIALSKYPLGNEPSYIDKQKEVYSTYKKNIISNLRKKIGFKEESLEKLDGIFEPVVYHLFSHFDVAFISLINNPKFPQRVFEPHEEAKTKIKTVSYQTLSGSIIRSRLSKTPVEILNCGGKFLKIAQVKVNNSLLIGNGNMVLTECYDLIEQELDERKLDNYILVDSYNWAEIILIILDDTPDNFTNALMEIRDFTLNQVEPKAKEKIVANSLYKKWGNAAIENAKLFSESHSFLSVKYDEFLNIPDETRFKSLVEWQVKPGHFIPFLKSMKQHPAVMDGGLDEVYFKTGKTDFMVIGSETDTIAINKKVFSLLRDNNSDIVNHVRKIKTTPLLPLDSEQRLKISREWQKEFSTPQSSEQSLYRYRILESREVSNSLKKVNVSRNIRKKIHKIIYDYNLGIQDPVLFSYFIDLHPLLDRFIKVELEYIARTIGDIVVTGTQNTKYNRDSFGIFHTKLVEDVIEAYIKVFEEAIQDRILNNYNYEDLNEFSLDTNSSLSGILSSLDAVIKLYGDCFRGMKSIVTTINDKETLSNKINVNYNIEHITNPPLIFATLIKEISNVDVDSFPTENSGNWEAIFKELELEGKITRFERDFLDDKDFKYFEGDFKKFRLTFFGDTDLFTFWHWVYALQNTHLYSTIGCFGEKYFTKELFRLVMMIDTNNPNGVEEMRCPIPELRSLWDKHFNRVVALVRKIRLSAKFQEKLAILKNSVNSSLVSLVEGSNKNKLASEERARDVNKDFANFVTQNTKLDISEFKEAFILSLNSTETIIQKEEINKNIVSDKEKLPVFAILEKTLKNDQTIDSIALTKSTYFKHIARLSYYSLNQIYYKFNRKIRLLRRNFHTGEPMDHFLQTEESFFVDPFGGFFINDIDEIEFFMEHVNVITSLIRHLGNTLKKESF